MPDAEDIGRLSRRKMMYGQQDEEAHSEDAGMDRGAKAPPLVSRPGPHGPRTGDEPGEVGQDR